MRFPCSTRDTCPFFWPWSAFLLYLLHMYMYMYMCDRFILQLQCSRYTKKDHRPPPPSRTINENDFVCNIFTFLFNMRRSIYHTPAQQRVKGFFTSPLRRFEHELWPSKHERLIGLSCASEIKMSEFVRELKRRLRTKNTPAQLLNTSAPAAVRQLRAQVAHLQSPSGISVTPAHLKHHSSGHGLASSSANFPFPPSGATGPSQSKTSSVCA